MCCRGKYSWARVWKTRTSCEAQARELMEKYTDREFALVYSHNPETNKGFHYLYSGVDNVNLNLGKNEYLLWHTRPGGTMLPSDMGIFTFNLLQKQSIIFPRYKPRFTFNANSNYVPLKR